MKNIFLLITGILVAYSINQISPETWNQEDSYDSFTKNDIDTSTITLADLHGKELSFDEVKNRYKGKIIYVEFWASWCGPCRELMPSSRKLREALAGKNIVFIYLSIDSKLQPWLKACSEEKLESYRENYLVLNQKDSEFLKKNLSFIPIAMVFDKAGRLITSNSYPGEENLPYLSKLAEAP